MGSLVKDVVDNFKTYTAIVSGATLLICILIAAFSTNSLFLSFGIDFFAKAELGDYITLGIRKVMASASIFVYALFVLSFIVAISDYLVRIDRKSSSLFLWYNSSFIKKYRLLEWFKVFANPLLYILLYMIISISMMISSDETLDSKTIKSAKGVIKTVKYGKNETELKCLTFIGDTGSFSHYWSLTNKTVFSINTSAIQIVEILFDASHPPYTESSYNDILSRALGPKLTNEELNSPRYEKWRVEYKTREDRVKETCLNH